jgi:hypothetical protein
MRIYANREPQKPNNNLNYFRKAGGEIIQIAWVLAHEIRHE